MSLGQNLPFESKYKGQENKTFFPDSGVDPQYKVDPEGVYVKEMLEALYCKFLNGSLGDVELFSDSDLLRLYGAGMQPESIYKAWSESSQAYPTTYTQKLINGVDVNVDGVTEKLMKGWHNVNFSVVSPMPQIKQMTKGMLDGVDYDIHADTLDPISNEKKENDKVKLIIQSKFNDWFESQSQKMGVPYQSPDFVPESNEQLELFDSYGGFKLQCARIMQMLIRFTYEISGYNKTIRDQLIDDLLDLGSAVIQDKIDFEQKRVLADYIDRKCFFIQPSKYIDHRDSTYGGVIKEYDISYLASMGIPRDKLEEVAQQYLGLLGNPTKNEWSYYNTTLNDNTFRYDFFKVAVVEASWIEEDSKYKRWVKNRYGRVRSYEAPYKYLPKKDNEWVTNYTQRMLYEGSWVIGTSVTFSFGISYNQPREEGKLKLPFHYYALPYASMVKTVMPYLDEIMFNWLHYQNGMSLSLPDGIAMDVNMMMNVEITKGKTATITDIIKFAKGHRVYPYSKSITGQYEGGNPTPFSPVQGIQERIIADFNNRMDICMKNIATITGINPATLPQNNTATESQLAYNATLNVLKPVVNALFSIKQSCAENICWRIQNAVKFDKSFAKAYQNVISDNDMKVLKESEGWGAKYGIMMVARPTERDIQNILQGIDIEVQQGLLDTTDRMFIIEQINSGVDIRLIRMYVQSKIAKNKELARQNQMEAIERQNQGNLAVNQQQGKNMAQKQQMDIQKAITEVQAKGEEERKTQELIFNKRMDELLVKLNEALTNQKQQGYGR